MSHSAASLMPYPLFRADRLDDLMNEVYEDILAHGASTQPSRGPARERTGVVLELTNPRARLSRSETRGKLFSCLGELLWYLSGRSDAAFIRYYVSDYPGSDDTGHMPGAYGPRLFKGGEASQFARVRDVLARRTDSRQAVIQIFDRSDLETGQEDVPCTCTLQFMARGGELFLIVHMRSNDAYLGLPHDVFCFTMMQEIMAMDLGLSLGSYRHFVGSVHLYEKDVDQAEAFLKEGWQSVSPMPAMPATPWDAIPRVLDAEARIREGQSIDEEDLTALDPYWADVIRVLSILRLCRDKDQARATGVATTVVSDTYRPFVDARIARLK